MRLTHWIQYSLVGQIFQTLPETIKLLFKILGRLQNTVNITLKAGTNIK